MKFKGIFLVIITLLPLKLLYPISPENLEKIIQQDEKESKIAKDIETKSAADFSWENKKFSIGMFPVEFMDPTQMNQMLPIDFAYGVGLQIYLRYWPWRMLQISLESSAALWGLHNLVMVSYGYNNKNLYGFVGAGVGFLKGIFGAENFLIGIGGGVEFLIFKSYSLGLRINAIPIFYQKYYYSQPNDPDMGVHLRGCLKSLNPCQSLDH